MQERMVGLELLLHDLATRHQADLAAEREAREAQSKSQYVKTLQVWMKDDPTATMRLAFEGWSTAATTAKASQQQTLAVDLKACMEQYRNFQERFQQLEEFCRQSVEQQDRELRSEREARQAQSENTNMQFIKEVSKILQGQREEQTDMKVLAMELNKCVGELGEQKSVINYNVTTAPAQPAVVYRSIYQPVVSPLVPRIVQHSSTVAHVETGPRALQHTTQPRTPRGRSQERELNVNPLALESPATVHVKSASKGVGDHSPPRGPTPRAFPLEQLCPLPGRAPSPSASTSAERSASTPARRLGAGPRSQSRRRVLESALAGSRS